MTPCPLPHRPFPRLAFAIAALACATTARAETVHDEQAWLNLTAMGSVSGDVVYFAELQPRVGDGVSRLDALLLRGAVGLKLSPARCTRAMPMS